MQTITDLVWTLMISLQFTSFIMIVITFIIQVIAVIIFRDTDRKLSIKINPVWLSLMIFSTFYLMHI